MSLVEPMLALRDRLREHESYDTADCLREIVTAAGVEVHDTETGSEWSARPTG
jgi:cysteinyl-tRNA synthetase